MKIRDILKLITEDQYIEITRNDNIYLYGYLDELDVDKWLDCEVVHIRPIYDLGMKFQVK